MIVASDQTAVRTSKDDLRVFGQWRNPARLPTTDVEPVTCTNAAFGGTAGDAHGGIVLLRAIDVIGKIVVDSYPIELRGRLVLFGPTLATVIGNVGAAIVAVNHAVGIVGSKPEIVIVAVRHRNLRKGSTAIVRAVESGVEYIASVDIFWISINAGVVPGALAQPTFLVDLGPGATSVIRAKHTTVFRFHDGPYPISVSRAN